MDQFADLFDKIDQTKSINEKTYYIAEYFKQASAVDGAWALYFLSGQKVKRIIGASKLFEWGREASGLPEWIVEECYASVGDVGETIALLLFHSYNKSSLTLTEWVEQRILPLQGKPAEEQKEKILHYWKELDRRGIFILNKILTGSLRVGVSQQITIQALSQAFNVSAETLSVRLMGDWIPDAAFFESLKAADTHILGTHLNPYPFYLASPLEDTLDALGATEEWMAEWKWDGIRAQCIKRDNRVAIWSRRNELITGQFPELVETMQQLENGTVLDGEILAFKNKQPLPFGELQKRLGRKKVTRTHMESVPIVFMIYDILEHKGKDLRSLSFLERRAIFEHLPFLDTHLMISPLIAFEDWNALKLKREEALRNGTEGIMLKKRDSEYGIGRKKGHWWKYKIDPKTIDAILIYAQPGQGARANLYTDYTFGVWHHDEIVPITKAYSGLTQEEITTLDRWIRKNTLEKFGPVRKVKAEQVFEIAFEGIQKSARHKSGIALRFPRIARWRTDKAVVECDTLESIQEEFFKEFN